MFTAQCDVKNQLQKPALGRVFPSWQGVFEMLQQFDQKELVMNTTIQEQAPNCA